jgi:hypothetical protein
VRVGARRVRVLRSALDRYLGMISGASVPDQTLMSPEPRAQLISAIRSGRTALDSGRKTDFALALRALVDAAEIYVQTVDEATRLIGS